MRLMVSASTVSGSANEGQGEGRAFLTSQECINHVQPAMHTGVMQRHPTVDVRSIDSNAFLQCEVQDKVIAVDSCLVQAIPLVDVVFGLDVHQARVKQDLERFLWSFIDGCKEGSGDPLHQRQIHC